MAGGLAVAPVYLAIMLGDLFGRFVPFQFLCYGFAGILKFGSQGPASSPSQGC